MAQLTETVTLVRGLTLQQGIGNDARDVLYHRIVLREPSYQDELDAMCAAERPTLTDDGWRAIPSAAAEQAEMLRLQVVRIESDDPAATAIPGPIPLSTLGKLYPVDVDALQLAQGALIRRGRSPAADDAAAESDGGAAPTDRGSDTHAPVIATA